MWLRVTAMLALCAGTARADDPPARDVAAVAPHDDVQPARDERRVTDLAEPKRRVSTARRIVATLVAVGPGLLLRGAGSYLVGEKRTAKRLATTAAIGFGGMALGGVPVGISGGNPYTIVPGVPILLLGSGMFLTTWASDIAVAAGASPVQAPRSAPPWSIELGTVWLHDPYRDRGLARLAGTLELGRIGLGAGALLDAEDRSRDGDLELRVRIAGAPATGTRITDGSRLVVRGGLRVHRDYDDRVTVATGELELAGRLDLQRLDDRLHGTFAELSTGLGLERASFASVADYGTLLLGTFAWGVYLGGRGELALSYDHRRDTIIGGIAAGRAAGFVGSVGLATDYVLAQHWAVRARIDYGNAWVTTFAIRYQGGGP